MYCKKCGFQIPDGKSVCPFCGTNNNETPNQVKKEEYKPVDENTMTELRNSFGYIDNGCSSIFAVKYIRKFTERF